MGAKCHRLRGSMRAPGLGLGMGMFASALLCAGLPACSDESSPAARSASVEAATTEADCGWPMAGHDLAHTGATGCATAVNASTVGRLAPVWFAETAAEVTGAPVADADTVYFGDWAGVLHAVARADGAERWRAQLPTTPLIYAGQITASPALAEIGGQAVVVAASGNTVVASHAADGSQVWAARLGTAGDPADPTEIQGAPVVAGDRVLVPFDVHNTAGRHGGLVSLSLADGTAQWHFDPEQGAPASGCGDIWGSAAVDPADGLVVVGTGNCEKDAGWTRASEAIVGIDLATGAMRWSYQPHPKGNGNDWDFAGAPNLFTIGDRPVAGLGNKDGWYYVVDRRTGKPVWKAEAQRQASGKGGFSFGGFIGALALVDGAVVGGTAVGDCPCQDGFDAATGKVLWQSRAPTGTYAAAGGVESATGGLVFQTGVDQTLRAFAPRTGKVVWKSVLRSISSSGPTIAGNELFIGTGFREPGSPASGGGGVQAFRVLAEGEAAPPSSTTTVPMGDAVIRLQPSAQQCVGAPCALDFTLKDPPAGTRPSITVQLGTDPFSFTATASGLGDPKGWLDPQGASATAGATTYMAFLTPRDDKPELGSILCTFGPDGSCTASAIAHPAAQYTRLSIVAVVDAHTPPSLQEGFDRLVTTHSLDPPLVPAS